MRGRKELFRARLALGLADPACVREGQRGEGAGRAGGDQARATGEIALPGDVGDAFDSWQVSSPLDMSQVCRQGNRPRQASRRAGRRRAAAVRCRPRSRGCGRAGRQVDARSRTKGRCLPVDVQDAAAFEDVDHLVVAMEVVRRAPGRDVADELGDRGAAALRGYAEDELARRRGAVPFVSLEVTNGVRSGRDRLGIAHDHGDDGHPGSGLDPPGGAPADPRPDAALAPRPQRRRGRESRHRRARTGPRRPQARAARERRPGRRRGRAAQTSRSRKRHRSREGLRPCHREPSRPRRFPEVSKTPSDESNRTCCGEPGTGDGWL